MNRKMAGTGLACPCCSPEQLVSREILRTQIQTRACGVCEEDCGGHVLRGTLYPLLDLRDRREWKIRILTLQCSVSTILKSKNQIQKQSD